MNLKKRTITTAFIGYTVSSLLLILCLIFFHFKGITYYDEGYILNSALRIAHGQVPYRDFDMAYTPISFLTTAAFLKIFGESIFAGRIAALVISVASVFALYKLLNLVTKNRLLILLCLLFFIAWGPAHINFPWPVMFAICFFFYTAFFYLRGIILKNLFSLYIAGIMTALIFFTKQNFGAAIIATTLLSFLFLETKYRWAFVKYFLFGLISAFLIALLTLLSTSSLLPFIHNMDFYTIKRIIIDKSLNTPFLYEGPLLVRCAKLVFYLSPLLFSIIACYFSRKTKYKLFIIGLFTLAFYVIGIRPTTDYVHLVPLLAVSGICVVIIIQNAKNVFIKSAFLFIIIFLTLFGFYKAYFSGYYKWETPLRDQTFFTKNPRIRVYLFQRSKSLSEQLITYIDTNTEPGQYIFINYYYPLVYFLADRRNATRYDLTTYLSISMQKEVINDLQKKGVRLVIIHSAEKNAKTVIVNYIRKQYKFTRKIGDFLIYKK